MSQHALSIYNAITIFKQSPRRLRIIILCFIRLVAAAVAAIAYAHRWAKVRASPQPLT